MVTEAFGLPNAAKFLAVRLKWFSQSGSGVGVGGNGVSVGRIGVGGITVCVAMGALVTATVAVAVAARAIANIAVMVGMGAMVGAGGAAWHAVRVRATKIALCCRMVLNGSDIVL